MNPALGVICLLAAGGFGLRWFLNKKKCEQKREELRKHYDDVISKVKDTIRALCAERVDYLTEIVQKDSVSEQTAQYLTEIEVGQYVNNGGIRNIGSV